MYDEDQPSTVDFGCSTKHGPSSVCDCSSRRCTIPSQKRVLFGSAPKDNSCSYANDGECDEPHICDFGTDSNDCSNSGQSGLRGSSSSSDDGSNSGSLNSDGASSDDGSNSGSLNSDGAISMVTTLDDNCWGGFVWIAINSFFGPAFFFYIIYTVLFRE